MTNEEKSEIEWATKRIAEIQPIAKTPMGGAILLAVEKHLREKMPRLIPEFQSEMQTMRRDREERVKARMEREGPKQWAILHSHALIPVVNEADETAWLNAFIETIGCPACRSFAAGYISDKPPTFPAYFDWTVIFHNAVNVKLGKPTMTIREAMEKWVK